MNNLKHSSAGATAVIILLMYYTFFILIVSSVANIENTARGNASITSTDNLFGTLNIGDYYCNSPRYSYDATSGEATELRASHEYRFSCDESVGVLRESSCNEIEGCNWENITSGWWFWETTEASSCFGTLNYSHYNINASEIFGTVFIDEHANGGNSPCNHPSVFENETMCEIFSCSWEQYTVEDRDEKGYKASLLETTKLVFTFNYTFSETNDNINFIMYFIFIIVPFMILIIALYLLVHPVK